MSGQVRMLRLNRQNKGKYRDSYTLPQDPYLDIAYHVIVTLVAFCVLLICYMIFQWPDFLIFLLISILLIFMSAFPLGQSRWGQVKASLWISLGLWLCFAGVFAVVGSKGWTIFLVLVFSLSYYLLTLKDMNLRLYLGLGVLFLPIFIHLVDDPTMIAPANSIQMFINYSVAMVICALFSVAVAVIQPRRYEAKVLIAMTEYIYALRRMLSSTDEKGYRDNLYCMYRHLYYLRQQKKNHHKHFTTEFNQIIDEYVDVVYQIVMIYVYIINNHAVKLPFYEACLKIDNLLDQDDLAIKATALENRAFRLQLLEENVQLKKAIERADARLQLLNTLYIKVKALRKKYA
ncbi:hypothetical protein GCM10010995_23710 [Cysteiniphilum litorale]|uniref:FUSC family protein n=2 Tax=Fastidiosibacteraceae TaxID=2056687 RepID=A0A8J2Z6F8_9GAMM|nr:hypothetical protein GCM10010995_23710 [Cysteiniphilum litorale]